jgi:hypothetical protein
MFPGIGVIPERATGSHVVSRVTPVAPLDAAAEWSGEEESPAGPRGKPLEPSFPKYLSCLRCVLSV